MAHRGPMFENATRAERAGLAYADGWGAAEAWHAGEEAPTAPPRGWERYRCEAWIRGFCDAEDLIEGARGEE